MAKWLRNVREQAGHRWWFPTIVLAVSLGLTIFATYYAARTMRLQGRQAFNSAAIEAHAAVRGRMNSYLALLRGGSAFFAASDDITRDDFHKYVENLQITAFFPGIQGIGFTMKMDSSEVPALLEKARKEGFENFRIWPMVPNEEIHTIYYLEPLDVRNRAAIGYNMYTEPVRRKAMQQACDSGMPVATSRVTLVQEIMGPVQPGFLIYMPVYAGGNTPPSIEERRKLLKGFIYSPFRAEDLFDNVFGQGVLKAADVSIYDGKEIRPENLLHQAGTFDNPSDRSSYRMTLPLKVAERSWTLQFHSHSYGQHWWFVAAVFAAGAVLTGVLFVLTLLEAKAHTRVELVNRQLTESEASLREARQRLVEQNQNLERIVQERTARLSETVRDLEAVLYHVAHDLRAPVRAMGSFATILHEDYVERLDERAQGYLNRISNSATRMDRLVNDLLAYGRLAQMPVQVETVSLQKAVTTALDRVQDDIDRRSAVVEVQEDLPRVCAHAGVLTEALCRLLDNALKFVAPEQRPHIVISATNGEMVRLKISDNGIGIEPEYHERIFRVFEKLHPHTAYPGTGIGLAIVKKAAEKMGGTVGVDSKPGSGSCFWLDLPLCR